MELEQMWQSALGEIQVQLSQANFSTWLKHSQLVDRRDGTCYIAVQSTFAKKWVEDKYQKNLLGILRNMDTSVKKLEFVIGSESMQPKKVSPQPASPMHEDQLIDLDFKTDPETGLNPRYQFSTFVVGPANELAFAAAETIVESVGKKYNPFFVYGAVGLGKTHLLQAIGNEILKKYDRKIRPKYISCEQFGRDVVWGIRNKRMEDVKKKYRDIDTLIIDDIQFIGGKDKMEEEFFHTFNALYENNKQIIISSDKPPHSLPILQERLRSRFEGGFVADIGYPEFEVRVAIIRAKLAEANRQLSDDVVNLIAKRLKKNIREIEGVLKKILFEQGRKQVEITTDMAEIEIVKATQNISRRVADDEILKAVAEFFSVSVADIISHSRRKEVVEPRQIAMYLLRDISDLSYPHIGEKMGRDHTTAIHSYEKINQEVTRNQMLNQKILTIKELIYKAVN